MRRTLKRNIKICWGTKSAGKWKREAASRKSITHPQRRINQETIISRKSWCWGWRRIQIKYCRQKLINALKIRSFAGFWLKIRKNRRKKWAINSWRKKCQRGKPDRTKPIISQSVKIKISRAWRKRRKKGAIEIGPWRSEKWRSPLKQKRLKR